MSRARDNANLSPTIPNARMPNLTGDVTTVEGAVATTIATDAVDLAHMSSESVDEDNLHISNAGSNGEFLSKQSGNAGGLTWAAASGGTTGIDDNADAVTITIDDSYDVGIGYTTPVDLYDSMNDLVVGTFTGGHGITILSQSNNAGTLSFAQGTSSSLRYHGTIDYSHNFGTMGFHVNGGTRVMTLDASGNMGIGTTIIGYKLEVDGTFAHRGITDMSRRILKENIEVVSDENLIDKFKELPLYRYNFKPDVNREDLKDLAFREFGEEVDGEWVWEKWDEIFPNGHEGGRMWDCSDEELKAFLDEKAEEIRVPQRDEKYDKNSLNFGLIADDPILAEKFPELVDYRRHPDTNELESWGIRSTSYIGMLHGVIKELVERVETLENA